MKFPLEGYRLLVKRKNLFKTCFKLKNIENGENLAYFEVQTCKE